MEYIQELSLGFMSTIGKKINEDFPGCSPFVINCIIPEKPHLPDARHIVSRCENRSTDGMAGIVVWCSFRRLSPIRGEWRISMQFTFKSVSLTTTRGTLTLRRIPGVTAAITPMP